jgi:hypothetical protein
VADGFSPTKATGVLGIESMSSFFHEFQDHLVPILRSGDTCEHTVVEQIRSLPRSPFDLSIEVNISKSPADAARHFDRFFEFEAQKITIAAAYTEMNGFYNQPQAVVLRCIRPHRLEGLPKWSSCVFPCCWSRLMTLISSQKSP